MIIPSFKEIDEVADSRYSLVMLVSKRARKIVDGAEPLIYTKNMSPVTIAIEEIIDKDIVFGESMPDREYEKKIEQEKIEKIKFIKERKLAQIEAQLESSSDIENEENFVGSED